MPCRCGVLSLISVVVYAWTPVLDQFRSKPGPLSRSLPWVSPYHRRLDWCLWIAALGHRRFSAWFPRLLLKLVDNDREVTRLHETRRFPLCWSSAAKHTDYLWRRYNVGMGDWHCLVWLGGGRPRACRELTHENMFKFAPWGGTLENGAGVCFPDWGGDERLVHDFRSICAVGSIV